MQHRAFSDLLAIVNEPPLTREEFTCFADRQMMIRKRITQDVFSGARREYLGHVPGDHVTDHGFLGCRSMAEALRALSP